MILLKDIQRKIEISLIIIVILIISLFAINKFIIKDDSVINYNINGSINYNVTSKNNLNSDIKNQIVFVTSDAKDINIDFNYKYNFDQNINYKYKYKIEASVISDVDDDKLSEKQVYKKDELIKSEDYQKINNKSFNIRENVSLNFDKFNKMAVDYDNTVNVAINSRLKINLQVVILKEDGKILTFNHYITMPLEKSTFSIKKSLGVDKGKINTEKVSMTKFYINIGGITLIVVVIGFIFYELYRLLKYKKLHYSEFKYRKIMNDYDGIVVPINKIPKDNSIVTVKILYFKNMIDIQKELHLPILCYKSEDVIIYMIINNKLAYVYFLNDNKEKI